MSVGSQSPVWAPGAPPCGRPASHQEDCLRLQKAADAAAKRQRRRRTEELEARHHEQRKKELSHMHRAAFGMRLYDEHI